MQATLNLELEEAGMLDALGQPSALQSLHCPAGIMQTLLVSCPAAGHC